MRGDGGSGTGRPVGAAGNELPFAFEAEDGLPGEVPYLVFAGYRLREAGGVSGKAERSRGVPFIASCRWCLRAKGFDNHKWCVRLLNGGQSCLLDEESAQPTRQARMALLARVVAIDESVFERVCL